MKRFGETRHVCKCAGKHVATGASFAILEPGVLDSAGQTHHHYWPSASGVRLFKFLSPKAAPGAKGQMHFLWAAPEKKRQKGNANANILDYR